jgi:Xaa-Pro aminopeptidase
MTGQCGIPGGRLERLDEVLGERSLSAVWVARPSNFAWLVGGDNVVDRAGDVGVAAAGYDGDRVRVVTDDVEADRLRAEEVPDDVDVEQFAWHDTSLAGAVADRSPTPAVADFDVPGLASLDLGPVRRLLTGGDVARYRALGRTVAQAVEETCRDAAPDDTEREVAADLRGRLAVEGVDAPVTLVGSSARARRYRHYTPKSVELGEYALLSATAERDGLFASCTRTVAFDAPSWLENRHLAAARVEATALAATRAVGRDGDTAGEVFEAIREAYGAVGWSDEWRNHHQGGAAGFAGREWIATPDSSDAVTLPTAYAWNPTVEGAKSEDTVLVDASGYETLTAGDWPTATVDAVGFDEPFERPAILER